MKTKLAFIAIPLIALSACSTPQPPAAPPSPADAALGEASYNVSRSIVSLAETAQAANPIPLEPPPNPAAYGMAGLISVDWSGPVEPLVQQLAGASNYRLRVIGKKPAIPVLVSVYDKNIMIADVVRDVGYQCGRRASIVIFPECRVIELRYAKN